MYHYVSVPPPDADAIRLDLSVPPEVFDAEMRFLSDQGYHTISLRELVNHLQTGAPLPSKPIVLTFDDGYADQYENVFPTLNDFGFTGTFFIITGRADTNAPGYLTWQEIEEMAANGMEIGGHSLDHRFNLAVGSMQAQRREILPAHDAVAQHVPSAVPVFAYPSGSYNNDTLAIMRELNYVAAVTTKQGITNRSDKLLELRRIRIRGDWSETQFATWLAYWMRQK